MNRKFIAPFWFCFIFGIMLSFGFYNLFQIEARITKNVWATYWWFTLYPTISFAEAIVYWIIRKRNQSRRESWLHILFLTLAVLMPALFAIGQAFTNQRDPNHLSTRYWLAIGREVAFWGSVVVAHIFFVKVLIKTRSQTPQPKTPQPEIPPSENLLDDYA